MNVFGGIVALVFIALPLVVLISALLAIPTMLLVNAVFAPAAVAAVFGGPLGFFQAWGLNFICGLLFKSSSVSASSKS